jgi:hypothetical protein
MNNETQTTESIPSSHLTQILGHRLFRFIIAGLVALVVTFALLFFMRYLILGYDKSATETITRYFSLQTVGFSDRKKLQLAPIEHPGERPGISIPEELEIQQEAEDFEEETTIDSALLLSPEQDIEKDIQLPELETTADSTQEKLRLIKQQILAEED